MGTTFVAQFIIPLFLLLTRGCAFTPPAQKNLHPLVKISVFSDFLKKRGGQFFKMGGPDDRKSNLVGPPTILLGGFPLNLDLVQSQLESCSPHLPWNKGVIRHLPPSLYEETLSAALDKIRSLPASPTNQENWVTPVVFFSGIENDDLKALARVLVGTLFAETGIKAAVAKAVPPALSKQCRTLFGEIASDHEEAMARG